MPCQEKFAVILQWRTLPPEQSIFMLHYDAEFFEPAAAGGDATATRYVEWNALPGMELPQRFIDWQYPMNMNKLAACSHTIMTKPVDAAASEARRKLALVTWLAPLWRQLYGSERQILRFDFRRIA